MNDYEILLDQCSKELPIIEAPLRERFNKEGLYRNGKIYIEKNLPLIRKKEILAEEYGHHKTSIGNIINLSDARNRKQEFEARSYGIELIVTLDDLIECSLAGLYTSYSCADYLDITEEFFEEVLEHYYQKYGHEYTYKGYIFYFDEHYLRIIDTRID